MEKSDSSIGKQYKTILEEHHSIHTCLEVQMGQMAASLTNRP